MPSCSSTTTEVKGLSNAKAIMAPICLSQLVELILLKVLLREYRSKSKEEQEKKKNEGGQKNNCSSTFGEKWR
jgi:hypothetical protein